MTRTPPCASQRYATTAWPAKRRRGTDAAWPGVPSSPTRLHPGPPFGCSPAPHPHEYVTSAPPAPVLRGWALDCALAAALGAPHRGPPARGRIRVAAAETRRREGGHRQAGRESKGVGGVGGSLLTGAPQPEWTQTADRDGRGWLQGHGPMPKCQQCQHSPSMSKCPALTCSARPPFGQRSAPGRPLRQAQAGSVLSHPLPPPLPSFLPLP